MKVVHFNSAGKFRLWLKKNHNTKKELQVGFYKKASKRPGMTYKEAVDEALCFGWIDGIMHNIDAFSFAQRFTPRRPASIWSNINVSHVTRLTKAGKMHSAGIRAFKARKPGKTGVYSFEQKETASLPVSLLKKFKAHKAAWAFFSKQAPWYRRKIIHKINHGKKEETRMRSLQLVIAASAEQKRL